MRSLVKQKSQLPIKANSRFRRKARKSSNFFLKNQKTSPLNIKKTQQKNIGNSKKLTKIVQVVQKNTKNLVSNKENSSESKLDQVEIDYNNQALLDRLISEFFFIAHDRP